MTTQKKLNSEEKRVLLKNFLNDDIMFKAICDTFHEEELEHYIDGQLNSLLIKQ